MATATPKELADISEEDLAIQHYLNSDVEELSPEAFEKLIQILMSDRDRWTEEENNARAGARKINPNKGRKKLSKEAVAAAQQVVDSFDIDDIDDLL